MARMLEITGFRTPRELYRETDKYERYYLVQCIKEYEKREAEKMKKIMGK